MERFFNIIHYILFKGFSRLFMYLFKPLFKIYKIPMVKRYSEKKGINPEEEVRKVFFQKEGGFSIMYAGGMISIFTGTFFLVLTNVYCILFYKIIDVHFICIVIIFILSYGINHYLVFKNDKYLNYFEEFDKKSKIWKRVWALITLGLIIGIPFFWGITITLL